MVRRTADAKGERISIREALSATDGRSKRPPVYVDTDMPGARLRMVPGATRELSAWDRTRFIGVAAAYLTGYTFRRGLESVHEKRKKVLTGIAEKYPGLRGVRFDDKERTVQVTPKVTIDWDKDGLQEALGVTSGIVQEYLTAEAVLPADYKTKNGEPVTERSLRKAMQIGLLAVHGMTEDESEPTVSVKESFTVDENTLRTMAANGAVPNLEDAGSAYRKWEVRVENRMGGAEPT